MVSIPITTNPPTRPSRLFKNIWQQIRKSAVDILRVYSLYKPLRVFFALGFISFFIGIIPIFRFLYNFFVLEQGSGNLQSLLIGGVLLSISSNFFALGILGDLSGKNRQLIEQILVNQKRNQCNNNNE